MAQTARKYKVGEVRYPELREVVGPFYPRGIGRFHQKYLRSPNTADDNNLIDAAFAATKGSGFSFCRKATHPSTDGPDGQMGWFKELLFQSPERYWIAVLVPHRRGSPPAPEWCTAVFADPRMSLRQMAILTRALAEVYVP